MRADFADERLFVEQLKALSEMELAFDLDVIGFETAEIDALIDGLETTSGPGAAGGLSAIRKERPFWVLSGLPVIRPECEIRRVP